MTRLAKILIAGTALAILPLSQACAGGSTDGQTGSVILNGQVDLHTSISTLNTTVDSTGSDVGVQSTAAGNAVDITTMNDTHVQNNQYTSSVDISSDEGARITNVDGNVSATSQAFCNSAQVSTDPNVTAVKSYQECQAVDPSSSAYVDSSNVGGNLSVANTAIGNAFEEDTNAPNGPVHTQQLNASNINANTTAHVENVAGTVSVTGTAIGNNAQIIHY